MWVKLSNNMVASVEYNIKLSLSVKLIMPNIKQIFKYFATPSLCLIDVIKRMNIFL